MQERPGQDQLRKSWDKSSSQRIQAAISDRTGQMPAIPKRPPNMKYIHEPPPTSKFKVARPETKPLQPVNRKRQLFIWAGVSAACLIVALVVGIVAWNIYNVSNVTAGSSDTALNFLTALKGQQYDQAYGVMDGSFVIHTSADSFTEQAKDDDRCFGPVTGFTALPTTAQTQDTTQDYDYNITRSKLAKPYVLHLTMRQVTDLTTSTKIWKITSYGDDLGPNIPNCK